MFANTYLTEDAIHGDHETNINFYLILSFKLFIYICWFPNFINHLLFFMFVFCGFLLIRRLLSIQVSFVISSYRLLLLFYKGGFSSSPLLIVILLDSIFVIFLVFFIFLLVFFCALNCLFSLFSICFYFIPISIFVVYWTSNIDKGLLFTRKNCNNIYRKEQCSPYGPAHVSRVLTQAL